MYTVGMATDKKGFDNNHHPYLTRVSALSLAIAVIGASAFLVWPKTSRRIATPASNSPRGFVVTPQSFTDLVGTVTAITDHQLTVNVPIVSTTGEHIEKMYRVKVTDSTELHSMTVADAGPVLAKISLTDIAVHDRVQVFGSVDLFPLSTFEAKKLYKL